MLQLHTHTHIYIYTELGGSPHVLKRVRVWGYMQLVPITLLLYYVCLIFHHVRFSRDTPPRRSGIFILFLLVCARVHSCISTAYARHPRERRSHFVFRPARRCPPRRNLCQSCVETRQIKRSFFRLFESQ